MLLFELFMTLIATEIGTTRLVVVARGAFVCAEFFNTLTQVAIPLFPMLLLAFNTTVSPKLTA